MATALLVFCTALGGTQNPVVLFHDFSDGTSFGPPAELVEEDARACLRISNSDSRKSATVHIPLDAKRIAGQRITGRAVLKALNISDPPHRWNGIKVMLVMQKDGDTVYPQMPMPAGTFEWREAVETLRIPNNVTKAHLVLGLEKVSGTVWFDEVELRIGRASTEGRRSDTPFRGHDLARLRGAMHGPHFQESNVRDLGIMWNANHVRWQLNWTPMKKAEEWARNLEDYDQWLEGALEQFDQALPACEKYGLVVLLDLHTPPGGRAEHGVCRMFSHQNYRDHLVSTWQRIARRYKGNDVIYAYDLLNEPVEGPIPEGMPTWREIATRVTNAIREIDPGKPV
ncbi:MAG: cellulase family glycosylhydrolase, partial [Candidatus Hydrogenedentota bacterium]